MVGTFNLERYLKNSKEVDISDIDLSHALKYPLSEDEIHCQPIKLQRNSANHKYNTNSTDDRLAAVIQGRAFPFAAGPDSSGEPGADRSGGAAVALTGTFALRITRSTRRFLARFSSVLLGAVG